jgi:hypothetical protein
MGYGSYRFVVETQPVVGELLRDEVGFSRQGTPGEPEVFEERLRFFVDANAVEFSVL